jgi:hypothetical protein
MAAACGVTVVRIALGIFGIAPLDPNEGWNAYHAMAALAGRAASRTTSSQAISSFPSQSIWDIGRVCGMEIDSYEE